MIDGWVLGNYLKLMCDLEFARVLLLANVSTTLSYLFGGVNILTVLLMKNS